MEQLHIGRVAARYHLPPSALGQRRRIDGVLRDVLERALEPAVESLGIRPEEELCIRRLSHHVELRLSQPDGVLVEDWTHTLIEALRRLIEEGRSDEIVRYRSRTHALIDVVLSSARGDERRAWAWRQIGLPHTGSAGDRIVRALVGTPQSIVAVLRELALAGLMRRTAAAVPATEWLLVAERALAAAGVAPRAMRALLVPDQPPTPSADEQAIARRAIASSSLARAAAPAGLLSSVVTRRPFAALALLESEPGRLGRGGESDAALVEAADRALRALLEAAVPEPAVEGRLRREREAAADRTRREREAERATEPATREPHDTSAPDASAAPVEDSAPVDASPAGEPSVTVEGETTATAPADAAPADAAPADAARAPATEARTARDATRPVEERSTSEAEELLDLRKHARTRAGGLLFLLHLVGELGLPDRALANAALAAHSIRWVLYRLALHLLPLEADDAAAFAFAGMTPAEQPPEELEPAPTDEEAVALEELAASLVIALRQRLRQPEQPREALLLDLCRRSAEIVADPGWIDVRLLLDEVSIDVRRAGLNLDPGWLPWLGVVVRFVYGAG